MPKQLKGGTSQSTISTTSCGFGPAPSWAPLVIHCLKSQFQASIKAKNMVIKCPIFTLEKSSGCSPLSGSMRKEPFCRKPLVGQARLGFLAENSLKSWPPHRLLRLLLRLCRDKKSMRRGQPTQRRAKALYYCPPRVWPICLFFIGDQRAIYWL